MPKHKVHWSEEIWRKRYERLLALIQRNERKLDAMDTRIFHIERETYYSGGYTKAGFRGND